MRSANRLIRAALMSVRNMCILRRHLAPAVLASLIVLGCGRAWAGLEQLNMSGELNQYSGFVSQGAPFGVAVPFQFSAIFDPTMGFGGGFAYLTQATFEVSGFRAVQNVPDTLAVYLISPSPAFSGYGVGLLNASLQGYIEGYSAAAPPFNAAAPTPTTFSGGVGILGSNLPMLIQLTNSDKLVIAGFVGPLAASITAVSPVPEPGSLALLGTGVLGLGLVLRRRRARRGGWNRHPEAVPISP